MSDVFKVAVIGGGRAGMLHAVNAAQWLPGAQLACVVETDEAAAQKARRLLGVEVFTTLEQAFGAVELDGVVITTPTFSHAELTVLAARAGKHVLCEKPMALTVEECDQMSAAAKRASTVLQIGFVRRFQPEFVAAKRRVDEGAVGTPMLVKSLTRGPGLPPPWAHDIRRSNGMLAELNSHDFDCARWFVSSEIARVYAETANFKGAHRGVEVPDFYDNAVVSLKFDSGAIGTIDGTCPADYGYDARVEIVGTEGMMAVGDNRALATLEIRERGHGEIPTFASWPQRFQDGYREELRSFIEAAQNGTAPIAGPADGRAAVAAVRAANQSWLEGRPVAVASAVAS